MGRAAVLAIVGVLVFGVLAVVVLSNAAGDGSETGVFPDRMFQITRSPPGGPKSDTYITPIVPTVSGRWSVRLDSLAGASMIVEVYRVDGSIAVLEGSTKLRTVGTSTAPVALFAVPGIAYQARFTPYGKPGMSVLSEHFVANLPPIACFTYSPTNPVVGQAVAFDGSCSSDPDGQIVAYDWDFGDQTTGTGVSVSHAYTAENAYTVTLRVTDDFQAYDTDIQIVHVSPRPVNNPPIASFTFTPTAPLVGEAVSFDGSASHDPDIGDSIVDYHWVWDDGSSESTGTNPLATHTYAAANTYTVLLHVTDTGGLVGEASATLRVLAPPTASFTFTPASPNVGELVTFDASGSSDPDGTIQSYAWTFGDGSSGSGQIATHAYTAAGPYTVVLTVTDADSLTGTASKIVSVGIPPQPPLAAFTYSPLKPLVGQTITFDASSSSDPDSVIVSYAWTFGDGTTGTGKIAPHAYSAYGPYDVTLTVVDSQSLSDTATATVTVLSPPTASFTVSPTAPLPGDTVTFDASGSTDLDGTIQTYAWTFGDGATGSGKIVTHAYVTYGTYPVVLTVTDNDGLTASASKSVRVLSKPNAAFTYSPAKPLPAETITFDASSSTDLDGTIVSYAWTFGDSSSANGKIVTHAYSAYGIYPVTLTVTDDSGLTATASQSVRVYSKPTASFTYSPVLPLQGATVSFDGTGSSDLDGSISAYSWNFGDSSSGSGAKPTHAYALYGTYPVTLTVTDNDGFTGTQSKSIRIAAAPVASFTFTPASPKIGALVTFDGTRSSDADGTISTYAWDFGDGGSGSGLTATHSYAAAGPFTVKLTVTDNDGFTGTASQTITVVPNVPPTAAFTYTPSSPLAGDLVTFDGSGSSDSDGTIVSYAWTFGDASCTPQPGCNTATGLTAAHTYANAGTYSVTLTVTDDNGATGTLAKDVTVAPKPSGPGEDWTFYDFFNVPYGEWWDIRQLYYGDIPIGSDCFSADGIANFWCVPSSGLPDVASFPYTNWVKTPVGDNMVVAPYRFTADIRQNPAFTVDRPVMLPRCEDLKAAAAAAGVTVVCPATPPTGGSISIDEHIGYMTSARARALADHGCPDLTFLNDGFISELQATVTMDSAAAAKLFGVTDPSTQWAFGTTDTSLLKAGCGTGLLLDPSSGVLEKGLKAWFEAQGNGPYDIYSAFGAPFSVFAIEASGSYDAVTGKSTLVMDLVAWGNEVLFARWAYWGATTYLAGLGGAAPAGWWGMEEPWTEDLRFQATFGASSFDATAGGAIQYHFRASGDPGADTIWFTADDTPKWVWQPILGDRLPSLPTHALSELAAYAGLTYIHTTPSSSRYGMAYGYDYVPAVWALKLGETQTFKFPRTTVVLYDPFKSGRTNNPRGLFAISAGIVFGSSVPATGVGTYDAATNTLRVVGPTSLSGYPTTPTGKPAESRPIYNLVRAPP